jgi:pimeloyl-ACP methyl ester carboxylesterase
VSIEHRSVTVGDLEFDVRIGGPDNGPAVLLLHGFPTTGACFDQVVGRLHESGLRTIVPDQRGYSAGARPEGTENYQLGHLVSDAIGILDALGVSYTMVVGHDFGSLVAWHLAAKYPQRVTGLVAISVGHPSAIATALASSDQRDRSSYILDFVKPGSEDVLLADDGKALRDLVPDDSVLPLTQRPALTAALNWYRANFTGDIKSNLACGPIEAPTTVLWGDGDAALGREQAEASGRFVYSDFRFSALEGVDHWIPQNAPAAVASEVALRSSVW